MISSTGDNLDILISCNYTVSDNWMSYLCWYSLSKNLPDANVVVACNRTPMRSYLFEWTKCCNVPFLLHKSVSSEEQINLILQKNMAKKPLLVLNPDTVAVRDFEESGFDVNVLDKKIIYANEVSNLCCDAKNENSCVFVRYSNGWGKFVTASWIDKLSCPFFSGNKYAQGDMTTNEVRIGRLWNAATPLFQIVSRGS